MDLSWIEISEKALAHNLKVFRNLVGKDVVLAPAIKANAYGHGLVECGRIFETNGADYLCVNALFEASELRKAGIKIPILVIGYTPLSDLAESTALSDVELIVYNLETIWKLEDFKNLRFKIHLKIETGNHRQGIQPEDLKAFVDILKKSKHIELIGVSTHFANLEDRIDHHYALRQLEAFEKAVSFLEQEGLGPLYRHCSNTAATILLPEARFNFVRVGIGVYGLWPSEKTRIAAERNQIRIELEPVMTWKTVVAQVKDVKKGDFIGYGCSYEMPNNGRIAVLPVGYYDGFVRLLSNRGQVLIRGKRCPVVGRVCMNMIMVDVSDIPEIHLEDEAVLLGKQGNEEITAEIIGNLSQTINYEVTTRINEKITRLIRN